jgi:hypothetical protein
MIDTTGPRTLRTESHAARRWRRTWNETNGANQKTQNLPDSVVVSQRGAVTLVRLSRPAKRNALDVETIAGAH